MTQQEIDKIKELKYKIGENTASLQEYQEYEQILINNGVPKEQLIGILRQNGIYSWEQYLLQRNKALKTFEQKRVLDSQIAGALMGVGAGLLLYLVLDSIYKK